MATAGAVAIVTFGLMACAEDAGRKERAGTVVGAVAGGLLGSTIGKGSGKAIAIGAGIVLGGIVGSEVGRSLDRADRAYMARTTEESLERGRSGETSTWVNPDSQHSGTVTPQPAYRGSDGRYCREFQQTVTIDGRTERAYGTACRQPDGSWQIVS
ncbi:MAG: RT0821/Lpp0805 family surface protein [Alphaproteobacteria bacterium]|nr:RT0821/Lpp0805 family surface protein [Alphaproteobacteria bacterium]